MALAVVAALFRRYYTLVVACLSGFVTCMLAAFLYFLPSGLLLLSLYLLVTCCASKGAASASEGDHKVGEASDGGFHKSSLDFTIFCKGSSDRKPIFEESGLFGVG